jgi:hypothetical protein
MFIIYVHTMVSRPEKSLHFWVNNPVTSLHIFINPKYHLHLPNQMNGKRALLRSNSLGIIWSDSVIIRYEVYTS